MKKILLSLLALSAVVLVACGPSKTYTAIETATKTAMTDLDTVTTATSVATIANNWATACSDAKTATGELKGEEATKVADLGAALQTKVTAKSDSLTQILIQQMTVVEEVVADPAAETAATPAK